MKIWRLAPVEELFVRLVPSYRVPGCASRPLPPNTRGGPVKLVYNAGGGSK